MHPLGAWHWFCETNAGSTAIGCVFWLISTSTALGKTTLLSKLQFCLRVWKLLSPILFLEMHQDLSPICMGNLQKIGHICFHIVGVSAGYVRYDIKYVIKCLCQMYFRYGVNRFEWVLKVWTQRVLLTYSWYCLNVCICFVGYFGGILEKNWVRLEKSNTWSILWPYSWYCFVKLGMLGRVLWGYTWKKLGTLGKFKHMPHILNYTLYQLK